MSDPTPEERADVLNREAFDANARLGMEMLWRHVNVVARVHLRAERLKALRETSRLAPYTSHAPRCRWNHGGSICGECDCGLTEAWATIDRLIEEAERE